MISAQRGLGKTWFGLDLSLHIVHGVKWLGWEISNPCSVMYIAGEMTAKHMQTRIRKLRHGLPDTKHNLILLSSEFFISNKVEAPVLTKELWRDAVRRYLELRPEIRVVIFDTVSALFTGLDENSKEEWGDCDQWLNGLRFMGVAPIIVHHVGASGRQRGTTSREDSLDASILLKRKSTYKKEDGCRFTVEFTKARNNDGNELPDLDVILVGKRTDPEAHFEIYSDDKERMRNLDIFEQRKAGMSYSEIGEKFGISKQHVGRILNAPSKDEVVT
jgi:putative DNA primase/helicase